MMNRRSFLKKLGLLAVVPFVPISAIEYFTQNPGVPYKCYKSNARNLDQLLFQIKAIQKRGLLQPPYPSYPRKTKVYGIISVKTQYWDRIELEIQPSARFTDVGLADKGFANFLVCCVPIVKRG